MRTTGALGGLGMRGGGGGDLTLRGLRGGEGGAGGGLGGIGGLFFFHLMPISSRWWCWPCSSARASAACSGASGPALAGITKQAATARRRAACSAPRSWGLLGHALPLLGMGRRAGTGRDSSDDEPTVGTKPTWKSRHLGLVVAGHCSKQQDYKCTWAREGLSRGNASRLMESFAVLSRVNRGWRCSSRWPS